MFNPVNAELNPICHLLALLGSATIVVVSRLRVKDVFHNCTAFNLLNAELNPICHLLALLGGATIVVVSRLSFTRENFMRRFVKNCFSVKGLLGQIQLSNLHFSIV